MAQAVVTTANVTCSFGTTPSVLKGTSNLTVTAEGKPLCVLSDTAPVANIGSFGMCSSLANPAVAAATAAALGVLTPQPCTPSVTGCWIPNNTKVLIGNQPALTLGATCMCSFGGNINIVNPGQVKVDAG